MRQFLGSWPVGWEIIDHYVQNRLKLSFGGCRLLSARWYCKCRYNYVALARVTISIVESDRWVDIRAVIRR